jgi:acetoacetyl-CoA synthetase
MHSEGVTKETPDDTTGPLWQPSADRVAAANLTVFIAQIERQWGVSIDTYADLHRFSVAEMEKFWLSLWDFCGVIAAQRGKRVLIEKTKMPGARFFPDARLNFAENCLRRRDDTPAIFFRTESGKHSEWTWRQLYDGVSRLTQAMRAAGIRPGDRVAGFLPNMPETVVAVLAAAATGAVWSSCSPDFGVTGVLDRFGQIEPRLLFAADGYVYRGERYDTLGRLAEIAARLPSVERVVVIPFLDDMPNISAVPNGMRFSDFLSPYRADDIAFESLPFAHPLYILYTSGTTGVPKCIVHSAGGTLLQHLKEHQLLCDVKPGDRVFYATTCGWMMWNWLVSVLASDAAIALYDGSPLHPEPDVLFDYADDVGFTLFGTSAKYLDAIAKQGLRPKRTHRLTALRTITSTGSPLMPEGFDYVYRDIKDDVCLSSISGGTDIISCFVGGNPIGPVWRGEIQAPGLGMAVAVFDEFGRPAAGEKGELVCTKPFPSMPLAFWNDPNGAKYRAAYFERFPGVWHHGDYAELTAHGGVIIYGRSDATVKPGGVRIGTAEIYRQVESFDEVLEAVCVGQEWQNDTRIVLFVRLREGGDLDDALCERIRQRIRANCSPLHVPRKIIQVADIPRTKSGKIMELAIREVIHGRPVKNTEALANPEALALYRDLPDLHRG